MPVYTSRKCKTTVKVQVVATRQLRFIDISVGWPGSMHDSELLPVLAPSLLRLVNLSLSTGVFPDERKLALVTPLLKISSLDPEVLGNFSPLSNLSFLSKLFERVVARELIAYLEQRSLLVPVQSAYRANHSTETALLKVLNDLLIAVDRGEAVVLALLHQSAEKNTIDHAILIDRLTARFGITGCVLAWFESYLFNRRQSVSVKGKSSRSVFFSFWCSSRIRSGAYPLHTVQQPSSWYSLCTWNLRSLLRWRRATLLLIPPDPWRWRTTNGFLCSCWMCPWHEKFGFGQSS